MEHNGQRVELPLIVTRGKGPSLLGRNWLSVLKLHVDWQRILTVKPKRSLQDVLDEHVEVFEDKLRCLKGLKAQIHIEPNAKPVFALRTKVEKELDRLRADGIIQPTQFSDWAAPIVPVMKGDGNVRICGDYKVTINKDR